MFLFFATSLIILHFVNLQKMSVRSHIISKLSYTWHVELYVKHSAAILTCSKYVQNKAQSLCRAVNMLKKDSLDIVSCSSQLVFV